MDSGRKSSRKYLSYTLAELEAFIAADQGNDVMVQEIEDRKAGRSVAFVVPQIPERQYPAGYYPPEEGRDL